MPFSRKNDAQAAPEPNIYALIATIVLAPTVLFGILFAVSALSRLIG